MLEDVFERKYVLLIKFSSYNNRYSQLKNIFVNSSPVNIV